MISEYIKYAFLAATIFLGAKTEELPLPDPVMAPDSVALTLIFAGDIMQHGPQIEAAWSDYDSTFNYHPCFSYVKPLVSSFDVAIANLEVTLAGAPYTGYPQFSAPDELAVAARDAGFDILATANNHSCDRGNNGLIRTLRVLDSLGIARTGTFTDSTDLLKYHPLVLSKNDITFALFNYTYGTNGLPFYPPAIVNLIDTNLIINDLAAVDRTKTDFIIVFFHWGNEYQSQPSLTQVKLAGLCKRHGADVIIGSHPHVLQRMEYDEPSDSLPGGFLLAYSLGNYVSNQRDRYRDGGAMISFTLSKTWNKKSVINPEYHLTWVHTPIRDGKKQYYILPVRQFENDSTMDTAALEKLRLFISDADELLGKGNRQVPEYRPVQSE
ncbi:poly-gamma-glutamate biosynthesis protein CapA/YwtB [Lentimicrobium saccharophilum]|uniref:Poly-gamma-glutamate biosynthesis protein CapA/YwtB n=1 Tax=Lentimicrobium saccharophilum TaxID=1678841 RepID=A0A0S7C2W0_9BACT|nr:CapA family protein [Lentimicrobium saccharophilum]GAP43187.1 poly-gamma-glutamate biosynthesis protein CapA/YwtB [Lentimicrobium saccharophilum]